MVEAHAVKGELRSGPVFMMSENRRKWVCAKVHAIMHMMIAIRKK